MKTTTEKVEKKVKMTRRNRFTAADKCRAVLALWTERSSGTELCRDLGMTWNQLNLWQEQAMEGMVQALEPKRSAPCGNTPLNPRLQGLLERKAVRKVLETPDQPLPAPKLGRPLKGCKNLASASLQSQP